MTSRWSWLATCAVTLVVLSAQPVSAQSSWLSGYLQTVPLFRRSPRAGDGTAGKGAGGKEKGLDYKPLLPRLEKCVEMIVVFGEIRARTFFLVRLLPVGGRQPMFPSNNE